MSHAHKIKNVSASVYKNQATALNLLTEDITSITMGANTIITASASTYIPEDGYIRLGGVDADGLPVDFPLNNQIFKVTNLNELTHTFEITTFEGNPVDTTGATYNSGGKTIDINSRGLKAGESLNLLNVVDFDNPLEPIVNRFTDIFDASICEGIRQDKILFYDYDGITLLTKEQSMTYFSTQGNSIT